MSTLSPSVQADMILELEKMKIEEEKKNVKTLHAVNKKLLLEALATNGIAVALCGKKDSAENFKRPENSGARFRLCRTCKALIELDRQMLKD